MKVNLIFEGIPGAGKTRLITSLMKRYPGVWQRRQVPVPVSVSEGYSIYNEYLRMLMESYQPLIFDGGHISELVYGSTQDYITKSYYNLLWDYDELIATSTYLSTIIVYVRSEKDQEVTDTYETLLDMTDIPVICLEQPTLMNLVTELHRKADMLNKNYRYTTDVE